MTSSIPNDKFVNSARVDRAIAYLITSVGDVKVSLSGDILLFETETEESPNYLEILVDDNGNPTPLMSMSDLQGFIQNSLSETFPNIEILDYKSL